MEIKPMTTEHLPAVAALEQECFSDPWSLESIRAELSNPLSCWLVAEQEQTLIGYVGAQSVPDEADVMNLAVCPQYRRQGIGEQLLRALCDKLAADGIRVLALEVRAANAPAKALYEKFGFTLAGIRPNYYICPKEDAWILKKYLEEP